MSKKTMIEGSNIEIKGKIKRFDIVKKVVNAFIEFEKDKKGRGVVFEYPVETLSSGDMLYVHRPGKKWNFDFKVNIPLNCGLEEGRHDQVAFSLRAIKMNNAKEFDKLWKMITELYDCSENDVDLMLNKNPISYKGEPKPDILLKVIKWLFIMEDIIYWHYEGRVFLYNFFMYVISESDEDRLKDTISKIRERKLTPNNFRKLFEKLGIDWRPATKE
nr:hypothetical protein [Candidatus Freyarchaeota archaeon]